MSKEINDIIEEVVKQTLDLQKSDNKLINDVSDISKEIQIIKLEVQSIAEKVDNILDVLNTLMVFIEEEDYESLDEEDSDAYESNEGWLPEIDQWEKDKEEDE